MAPRGSLLRHNQTVTSRPGARPYTVASTAPRSASHAAHRGALIAIRDELEMLCVEVKIDEPWPSDVAWAVQALHPRRRRGRTLLARRFKPIEVADDLRPADDQDFAIALAVVPYTISATGIAHDGHVPYSTYEGLRDSHFELTEAEHALTANYMTAHGADPGFLIQDQI